jgi:hypothetical protein
MTQWIAAQARSDFASYVFFGALIACTFLV